MRASGEKGPRLRVPGPPQSPGFNEAVKEEWEKVTYATIHHLVAGVLKIQQRIADSKGRWMDGCKEWDLGGLAHIHIRVSFALRWFPVF